jgi:hypothetical protein
MRPSTAGVWTSPSPVMMNGETMMVQHPQQQTMPHRHLDAPLAALLLE